METLLTSASPLALMLILLSMMIASSFNVVAFLGVKVLNATTWSLLGQFNSPMNAVVSHLIFKNEIAPEQIGSFLTSICGVYLFQSKGKVKKPSPRSSQQSTSKPAPVVTDEELATLIGLSQDDRPFSEASTRPSPTLASPTNSSNTRQYHEVRQNDSFMDQDFDEDIELGELERLSRPSPGL